MAFVPTREYYDDEATLAAKLEALCALFDGAAGSVMFFSGAGISTSSGIPDIRGTNGLEARPVPLVVLGAGEQTLEWKRPTYAHAAVASLIRSNKAVFVATSNHDGNHFPKSLALREAVADVFGNAYTERCLKCGGHFDRSVLVPTGLLARVCDVAGCGGRLTKTGTRMGAATPEAPLRAATQAARAAKLGIVLGSSMTVSPFCELPPMCGAFVLVTLQDTAYDDRAALCIHATCDTVMRALMRHLRCSPEPLVYRQPFQLVTHELAGGGLHFAVRSLAPNEPVTCVAAIHWLDDAGVELAEACPEFSSYAVECTLSPSQRAAATRIRISYAAAAAVAPLEIADARAGMALPSFEWDLALTYEIRYEDDGDS